MMASNEQKKVMSDIEKGLESFCNDCKWISWKSLKSNGENKRNQRL